jgi:hypothetical protein
VLRQLDELGRMRDDRVGSRIDQLLASSVVPQHPDSKQVVRMGGVDVEAAASKIE